MAAADLEAHLRIAHVTLEPFYVARTLDEKLAQVVHWRLFDGLVANNDLPIFAVHKRRLGEPQTSTLQVWRPVMLALDLHSKTDTHSHTHTSTYNIEIRESISRLTTELEESDD